MVPIVQRVPFIRQRGSICKLLLGRLSSQRRLHILSAEAVENCVHTAPLVISWDIQRLDARSETTGVSRCLIDIGTNSNCFTYIYRIAHQSQLLKPTTYFLRVSTVLRWTRLHIHSRDLSDLSAGVWCGKPLWGNKLYTMQSNKITCPYSKRQQRSLPSAYRWPSVNI